MASGGLRRWAAAALIAALAWPDGGTAQTWDCPPDTAGLQNPVLATPAAVAAGERLARASCTDCHGETGRGDGPAASALARRPANWRASGVQAQTDGCIFWKLTSGRGSMPASKGMPEADRWRIVRYIRSLATE